MTRMEVVSPPRVDQSLSPGHSSGGRCSGPVWGTSRAVHALLITARPLLLLAARTVRETLAPVVLWLTIVAVDARHSRSGERAGEIEGI
jgi:hypothetical protein